MGKEKEEEEEEAGGGGGGSSLSPALNLRRPSDRPGGPSVPGARYSPYTLLSAANPVLDVRTSVGVPGRGGLRSVWAGVGG